MHFAVRANHDHNRTDVNLPNRSLALSAGQNFGFINKMMGAAVAGWVHGASPATLARMLCLTDHARRRLAERGLLLTWVEATVAAPDWTAHHVALDLLVSFRAIHQAGGRILKVVHRGAGPDAVVITAHFDRKARR